MTEACIPFEHARAAIPDHVIVREMRDGAVLLNAETGRWFMLDDIGTRVWKALTSSASIQAAYEALLLEYEIDAADLRTDLEGLMASLSAHGLLEVRCG